MSFAAAAAADFAAAAAADCAARRSFARLQNEMAVTIAKLNMFSVVF
jgi:hypothetical protein